MWEHPYACFRYSIRIQSNLQEQFQLVERYWRICHASGELHTVRGPGVLGMASCNDKFKNHLY